MEGDTMDEDGNADMPSIANSGSMDVDSTAQPNQAQSAALRRPLPKPPGERGPMKWTLVAQGHRGKAACCRACLEPFTVGELRMARESDARSGASRWLHVHCIPGGLHAHDEIQGDVSSEPSVAAALGAVRQPLDTPTELPDQQAAASVATGDDRDLGFWDSWQWSEVFDVHITTLISVPNSLTHAFAERKGDLMQQLRTSQLSSEQLRL